MRSVLRRLPELATRTMRGSREDRLVGWSAEVAFFALLAIPSLILILAGAAGFVGSLFGEGARETIRSRTVTALGTFVEPATMRDFVEPAVRGLFSRGRAEILSIGAVIAFWSASRMTRVLIDAINAAYDVPEPRPLWRRRLGALGLTIGAMASMLVFIPFVVAGPRLGAAIERWAGVGPALAAAWRALYWPVAAGIGVALLATLYHVAPSRRRRWRREVPGALLAAAAWVGAAYGLRAYVAVALDEGALGPLGAPMVLMLWLYVSAFAVLLGAEVNAAVAAMWPARAARPEEAAAAT